MYTPRLVSATDASATGDLDRLNRRMAEFYGGDRMQRYYRLAHARNEDWDRKFYHKQIKSLCTPGMQVLDLGCGSAHAFENLRATGIRYLGVDWSSEQVERNRARFGDEAEFLSASLYDTGLEANRFDLVISLFTLEHLVFPHLFLQETVRLAKPGGRIVILCPNFRPNGRIPSLHFGGSVAPLKSKILGGHLYDSLRHLYLRNFYYPSVIKKRFPLERYPFLINVEPSCLYGDYYPDNDAVYFVDEEEVQAELSRGGAIPDPEFVPLPRPDRLTCFVVARKLADAEAVGN